MNILKIFWQRRPNGNFAGADLKGINLRGRENGGKDFFAIANDVFVGQGMPPIIGTIRSIISESIVPVVAMVRGENIVRSVGTAFFVSCSGLLITAAHVITDPIERRYGKVRENDDLTLQANDLNFGILIANNPLLQIPGFTFYPFEWSLFLAEQRPVPLSFMGIDLKLTSDIAICKVPPRVDNFPHQPLTMVQRGIVGTGMRVGSDAYALGYAGMSDFEVELNSAGQVIANERFIAHVSAGKIIEFFPDNFANKEVSTPGPCFSFGAKIPGGMSGGPIFDREGVYVHGVISKGWENEAGPERFSFGSMLRPSMALPISRMDGLSLDELQRRETEGIAILRGPRDL